MTTDRRKFLTMLGVAGVGAAAAVPSLEAETARGFSDLRGGVLTESLGSSPAGQALAVMRREVIGRVHPFLALDELASVDPYNVDSSKTMPASLGDDGVDRPFQYVVPVVASGEGANSSLWLSKLAGRATADADIRARLTGRDFAPTGADPITAPMYVDAGHSIRWDDPVRNLFGASGVGWMLIESSEELSFSESYTFNQAADGTQQGQALPIFSLENIMTNSHLSNAGDLSRFELYGLDHGVSVPTKRENWLFWVPEESGTARLEYWIEDAEGERRTAELDYWCEPGVYKQANGLHNDFPDYVPRPGDSLVVRTHSSDGESDVAVFQAVSHVDNIDSEKQDPYSNLGSITRLIRSASISMSPRKVEQNDEYALEVSIETADGGYAKHVWFDTQGDGQYNNGEFVNDEQTSDFYMAERGKLGAPPGTSRVGMKVQVIGENNQVHTRTIQGNEYEVKEASINEYPADTANPRIMDNLAEFARMLSVGQYAIDGEFYPPAEWESALQMYQDGESTPSNMEAVLYRTNYQNMSFIARSDDDRNDVSIGIPREFLKRMDVILAGE